MHSATKFEFRWLDKRDLSDVLLIEKNSFGSPWTESEFLRALRSRDCVGQVIEAVEPQYRATIGFFVYLLSKTAIEILNIAVATEFRRQGAGSKAVGFLRSKLAHGRRTRLIANVRESNLSAHLFFKANGLRATTVVRKPFDDCDEDGYRFVYRLPTGTPFERPPHHQRASE